MMRRSIAALLALWCAVAPAAAMNNPGPFTLGDFQIGAAGTQPGTPQLNFQGVTALSCQARFSYGAGGTNADLYIQTSLDQGASWFDIAHFQFGTASGLNGINLSGLNGITTPTALVSQALSANTTFNGPLGDRFQAVVVSTGTYTGGTLLSVRCVAR
jgi:hypothetical protein